MEVWRTPNGGVMRTTSSRENASASSGRLPSSAGFTGPPTTNPRRRNRSGRMAILTTMNLRPAGGTLRPGGHITCTMNLRRGCRPVTSATSRSRVSSPPGQSQPRRSRTPPRRPPATVSPPVGPPPGNRSGPVPIPPVLCPQCFRRRPEPRRPVGWPDGGLHRPRWVAGGAGWNRRGSSRGLRPALPRPVDLLPGADCIHWLWPLAGESCPVWREAPPPTPAAPDRRLSGSEGNPLGY